MFTKWTLIFCLFFSISLVWAQVSINNEDVAALTDYRTVGLVAHYPFSGDANDASGNGHHGVVHGTTLCTDRFGNSQGAYHFNSNESDYIRVADHQNLRLSTNLTISVWIKHSASASSYEDVLMKGNEAYGFQFDQNTDQLLFHLHREGGSWQNLNSGYTPTSNQWFNITGTYDGLVQRVYINGLQTNSYAWSGTIHTDTSSLDIGANVAYNNNWYNGNLDDLRIYNRVLSASEVAQLYNENGLAPSTPQNVQITHSEGNVCVSWQAVNGASSYRVYSSLTPNEDFTPDTSGSFDNTIWTAPSTLPHRFYRVTAVAR
ncbi:MAG: LamG domain-containing protein [Candidatus Cloacimonetes bacterium]|nr:LamG domain-containing protein [Candidatus Cloacimonadota bacterium]